MRAAYSAALILYSDTPLAQDLRNPRYPIMPLQNAAISSEPRHFDFTATASSPAIKP
jgi:hypothetical protein